mgnify:CR=1 FL=1
MRKSRFTDSQIMAVLRRAEGGELVPDLCREMGVSAATFYKWRAKFGGMDVNQLKRIKELEAELSQYKKIVAEQTLSITVLKDVIEKKL